MKIANLSDLFEHTLKDIYYAEKQIVKALPKMAKAADSPELARAFEAHLLEEAFDTGTDLDVLEAFGLADELQIDRHVLLDDGRDVDRGGRRRGWRSLFARRARRDDRRNEDEHCPLGIDAHGEVLLCFCGYGRPPTVLA